MLILFILVSRQLVSARNDVFVQQARNLHTIVEWGMVHFGFMRHFLSVYDSHRSGLTSLRLQKLSTIAKAIDSLFQPTSGRSVKIGGGIVFSNSPDIPAKNMVPEDEHDLKASLQKSLYDAILSSLLKMGVQPSSQGTLRAATLHYLAVYSLFLVYLQESDKAVIDASIESEKISSLYRGKQLEGLPSTHATLRDDLLFLAYDAVKEAYADRKLELRATCSPTLSALMKKLKNFMESTSQTNVWQPVMTYVGNSKNFSPTNEIIF